MKKVLIVLVAVALCMVLVIVTFLGSVLNEEEQNGLDCLMQTKRMMKNPDSFKLYDTMFMIKKYDENHQLLYTYTIFRYGGTNGYGAMVASTAVFKNGTYLMDLDEELQEDSPNYNDQFIFSVDWAAYKSYNYILGNNNVQNTGFETVELNRRKIKRVMWFTQLLGG